MIRIQKDSMSPSVRSQGRLLVDIFHGYLGADGTNPRSSDTGLFFKRLHATPCKAPKVRFSSDNPACEPYKLPANEFRVFRRVNENWSWW